VKTTRELFAGHSLRCTQQRMAVYESIRESRTHPSAEEIFRMVRPQTDRLSLATVYNTLEALCRAGLLRRMPTTDGSCRFDADTSTHVHVRYRDTSEIRDLPAGLSARLIAHIPADVLQEISEALDVEIDGITIQMLARSGGPASPTP